MNAGAFAATGAASAATTAAAAAAQRAREQEEEEMTPYSPQDLAEDWEFKILRSNYGSFEDPDRLQEILAEEARAGWVLVEKFDGHRIRLKRPANARKGDASLDFDPLRTTLKEQMPARVKQLVGGIVVFFLLCIAIGVAVAVVGNL